MTSKNRLAMPGSRLTVRNAKLSDVPAICALTERVYSSGGMTGYSEGAVTGQINRFREGQFVITVDGKVVGYCATFVIDGEIALKPHNWTEITGNGYASRHDRNGDWLYA